MAKIKSIFNSIRVIVLILSFFIIQGSFSQDADEQSPIVDVLHYSLEITVSDKNDKIDVIQLIRFNWYDTTKNIFFDLAGINSAQKGMLVESVVDGNKIVDFTHKKDKLIFENLQCNNRDSIELTIKYSGIPIDGLVIGENKYGNRTFFGDNWPDRAHNWFVCIDHPSDKATIDYTVFVPPHYQVVANGKFLEKKQLRENQHMYKYSSGVPLPTKVLVIGIADFEVKELGVHGNVPVSSWVYPENKENGFYDFDLAPQILEFYVNYIGPYEYEKLANVQSTTRYGGMENAGCIFYDENAINGKRTSEGLIAHEIAHQWFGNSVTEKDWLHVWLSEGFATYFTDLYLEHIYGKESIQKQMAKERDQVISFYKKYPNPVIDSNYSAIMDLLNPNSYQKGAWVLHMLRRKVGDEFFKKGIVAFYQKYRLSNADSEDFIGVMEEVSGINLKQFFDQWIYSAGHPKLEVQSKIKKKQIYISFNQIQERVFTFPLLIELTLKNGDIVYEEIEIDKATQSVELKTNSKVKSWKIDPFVNLLFEKVL